MRPLFAFCFVCGLCLNAVVTFAAPVDFTPLPDLFVRDSIPLPQFKFQQGNQEIAYCPPPNWSCTGNPDVAFIQPAKESSIRAEIRHKELPKFVPAFDEKGMDALRAQAQILLPPLPGLKLLTERQTPKRMSERETMDYTFSGRMFARNYKFYVFLLPMENEEFSFVLFAEEKEFDDASKAFFRSISTFVLPDPRQQK